MQRDWVDIVRRAAKKPPRYVARRMLDEIVVRSNRFVIPALERRADIAQLLRASRARSVDELWERLADRQFATAKLTRKQATDLCDDMEQRRILAAAERALKHEVDLLGSGLICLGPEIDWHRDYKSGHRWPAAYCRDIEYGNEKANNDVKFPWEVSRVQWLLPAGQAYVLTGDERYASGVREVLAHWMDENPCAFSVNWSCPMEAGLRVVSWTWLFHVFAHAKSWATPQFRARFLQMLYMHGVFLARNVERSDINGNHYLADAAGLAFCGLFFGDLTDPRRWARQGWLMLEEEIARQVHPDGVDFEASAAYHRLVLELLLLPALYRRRLGLDVSPAYRDRLVAMAGFTAHYTRPDGTAPLWGDADDGRVLPLGGQNLLDHRYLVAFVGNAFGGDETSTRFSGGESESAWLLGHAVMPSSSSTPASPKSKAFPHGGVYVLRNEKDHVFVDCGPIGLGGRGGHGHNDMLSFEAFLDGAHLVSDCGSYVYTSDYAERNLFRGTSSHNTPQVDALEINRFRHPRDLWSLQCDATPVVRRVAFGSSEDELIVSHTGYARLQEPIVPVRRFTLDHQKHELTVEDEFEGGGTHTVMIPVHLAIGLRARLVSPGLVEVAGNGRRYDIRWEGHGAWALSMRPARVSPSYGVAVPTTSLVWESRGAVGKLRVTFASAGPLPDSERPS